MHILLVSKANFFSSIQPGRRVELPRALAALGHQVSAIAACYTWATPRVEPGPYRRLVLLPVGNSPLLLSLLYTLKLAVALGRELLSRDNRPDVVVCEPSSVWGLLPAALLSRLRWIRTAFVLDIRTVPVGDRGLARWLKETEYHLAILVARCLYDGITAITPMLKADLVRTHRIDPARIGVWSSGASTSTFSPDRAMRPPDMAELDGKFVVMHHGGIDLDRGVPEAVVAMEMLRREYPDIVLFFLGDGSHKSALFKMVQDRDLEASVLVHPAVPYSRVPDYIAVADVGLIPLPDIAWWRVSSPQKLMEYLAMEKPVILSDIPAHRNVVGDSACAAYLDAVEPGAIAAAIVAAYRRRDELAALGKLGRAIVEREFTWDAQAKRLAAYLRGVCQARN